MRQGMIPGSCYEVYVSELAPGQVVKIETALVKVWLTKTCGAEEEREWVSMVSLQTTGGDLARALRCDLQEIFVGNRIVVGETWPIRVGGARKDTNIVTQLTVVC